MKRNATELIIVALLALFTGCATKERVIHEHVHHYQQADTMATRLMIDARLQSWHERMDSSLSQALNQYSASWFSHDDQKEVTTETLTETIDSLGRIVRQQQRTTERTLSRQEQQMQQLFQQQMKQEVERQLAHRDSIWQKRFNEMASHHEQTTDNSQQKQTAPTQSWWQRLWSFLFPVAIILFLVAVIWRQLNQKQ